jgi:hypothetical protein
MKQAAIDRWNGFWFTPEPTSTIAVIRIAYGLLMVAWTVSLLPGLMDFFASDGILPEAPAYDQAAQRGLWSVFAWFPSDGALIAGWVLLLVASICVTLGLFTRLATIAVWVVLLSLQRRTPLVHNAGDVVLRILGLYLIFAPAGAALSLDRLRHVGRRAFWAFPARAPIVIRLLQIQISIIYISTVWAKVRGEAWNDGTAVIYSLSLDDLSRFPVPSFVLESPLLANLATWSVLAIELGIGILVWNRKLRPYALLVGVAMHLGIDVGLRVGFFSYAMFVVYLSFLPPDTTAAVILTLRERLGRRREIGVRQALAPRAVWAAAQRTPSET